nr:cytochrome P450 734A1 [Tanacetum cinerariifolium]
MSLFFLLVPIILLTLTTFFNYTLTPLRIQHHFKKQGIGGPSYRPVFGNSAAIRCRMIADAQTEASHFSFNHNEVVQRVMPHYYNWSKAYGSPFLYWFGTKARLAISDPDMIKEILVSKAGSFEKPPSNPAFKGLFGEGLVVYIPTKKNKLRWKLEKETTELIRKLIEKNKDAIQHPTTLLASLISPSKKDDILDLKEIVDECKTFYFAGKETTANLLTWAFLILALQQEWQNKAREEVIGVCGHNAFPCANDLANLKTVSMILNETLRLYPPAVSMILNEMLRLYPPAVMMMRQASQNVKLGGTLDIPAGTQLFLAMTAIHHDPKLWGEDANEFNPMRFVEPRNHLASFFPFGLGSRVCVGQNLAMVEAKIVLAMIVRQYSFVISPTYVHAPMQSLTLQPQFGAQIIFSSRR